MRKEKILDPFLAFLPAIFVVLTTIAGVTWIILSQVTGILAILKVFMTGVKILTFVSGVGLSVSCAILGITHKLGNYCRSIEPTLYLHENLRIYKKISDYRQEKLQFSYAERSYNSCIFNSYIAKTNKNITVVITVPRNGDAQEILRKRAKTLRKDLTSRFPEYSFGGNFEQLGGFIVLSGSRLS